MKLIVKSLALAMAGAALFFSFFMMCSIPVLTALAKLHDPNAPLQAPDVIISPAPLFRTVGLPLAGVAFAICFVLAMKRYRRLAPRPSGPVSRP